MQLSTTTGKPNEFFNLKDSVKLLANAGFKVYDISLQVKEAKEEIVYPENYLENAKQLRKYADSIGMVCNQSHATFPSSVGDPEKDEAIFNEIVRDLEVAAILGAKIIVVHPKHHLTYAEHAEELFNLNVEFYKSLIPYCKKFGIKVAAENMFQRNAATGCIIDSTCSRAWEFCKYLDAIDSEWIVGCLDIGHTALVNADLPEFIRTMGNKRIQALHVHDNDGIKDRHTLPYTCSIDFAAFTQALADIDYKGDMTYEADNFFRNFPAELYPAISRFMYDVGVHLVNETEKKRNK